MKFFFKNRENKLSEIIEFNKEFITNNTDSSHTHKDHYDHMCREVRDFMNSLSGYINIGNNNFELLFQKSHDIFLCFYNANQMIDLSNQFYNNQKQKIENIFIYLHNNISFNFENYKEIYKSKKLELLRIEFSIKESSHYAPENRFDNLIKDLKSNLEIYKPKKLFVNF